MIFPGPLLRAAVVGLLQSLPPAAAVAMQVELADVLAEAESIYSGGLVVSSSEMWHLILPLEEQAIMVIRRYLELVDAAQSPLNPGGEP